MLKFQAISFSNFLRVTSVLIKMSNDIDSYNQPLSGNEMPRFAETGTMMRLPTQPTAKGLDACFVGVPFDLGTSNRSGARFGPRAIRNESSMIRPYNMWTRVSPFDSLQIADIGDVPINTFNLLKSVDIIEKAYDQIMACGTAPFTLGGDHTIVLPIMRALAKKHGPLGIVHIDAHADVNDTMFGEKIAHGTPFRRMVEEKLIQPNRVVQIGLRTTGYESDDFDWPRAQGFRVVQVEDCWHKSLVPLMEEVRQQLGEGPVYISFDIDGLDPAYAPGTGTLEPGGLTSAQAFEIVRGCRGLDIVGGDLVEVAPAYDHGGITATLAANLLYEMLCTLPKVKERHDNSG